MSSYVDPASIYRILPQIRPDPVHPYIGNVLTEISIYFIVFEV